MFGLPLEQAIKQSPILNGLPFPLTRCVDAVERYALHEEGIYRRAGAKNSIEALVKAYDTGKDPDLQAQDPYTVCCVLKEYLKKLPEPLTSYELYNDFMEIGRTRKNKPREASADEMRRLIEKLPESCRYVLYFVIRHLQAVAQHHDENKMSITNLSIVFGPNLFRSLNDSPTAMLGDVSHQGYCVDLLIRESDTVFGSIAVDNKKIAVMDDPLSQFTAAHSPAAEKPKAGDTDNSPGNRSSRRFGGGQDKRKGLSLIELKLNEDSPASAGRGLFRPESTRIIFNDDNKSKQVTYSTDDITQLVKNIVNETLDESAHKAFKRTLNDGYSMLRPPKKASWKSEEPEDTSIYATNNSQRRSSAVEEYTKDLDHASDVTSPAEDDSSTHDTNSNSHKDIEPLTEETIKKLESHPIDINSPIESINARLTIKRGYYSQTVFKGLDTTRVDEKWNVNQLYLEKTIIREEIYNFEEAYKKAKHSQPTKEVKEHLRPIYQRYYQARDLYELFESKNRSFLSQMSMESPLHQVAVFKRNSYSHKNGNRLSNNPYMDGRRSISFSLRGKSSQIQSPEFKQILLKNPDYAEMRNKKQQLKKSLLTFEKQFKDTHKRKMKYKSDWGENSQLFDEYKLIRRKMVEFALKHSRSRNHNHDE